MQKKLLVATATLFYGFTFMVQPLAFSATQNSTSPAVKSQVAKSQNATTSSIPKKTTDKTAKLKDTAVTATVNTTADKWINLDANAKPVYVGIHGGTAPVSLLHAPNGVLVAITGQTGNDFTKILNGSTSNSSSKTADVKEAQQNATAEQREDQVDPQSSLEVAAVESATPEQAESEVTLAEGAIQNEKPMPWYKVILLYSGRADGGFSNLYSVASLNKNTQPEKEQPKAFDKTDNGTETSAKDIIAAKPENYPAIVFASDSSAKTLMTKESQPVPFGLSVYDAPADSSPSFMPEEVPVTKKLPAPLRLKDYRVLLSSI